MLTITARQMAAFDAQEQSRFEQRVASHLKKHFAHKVAGMSDADLLAFVRASIAAAAGHGLEAERDVVVFAGVAIVLGLGFDEDPRHGWAKQILSDPFIVAPSLRVDLLHRRAVELLDAAAAEPRHA